MRNIWFAIACFCFISIGETSAKTIDNFSQAKREARKIFSDNKETLYCHCKYDKYGKVDLKSCGMSSAKGKKRARRIEWEHIVPASNFGQHFKCWRQKLCSKRNGKRYKGRKCCEKIDKNFRKAEADLYNLWPSVGLVNGARSNYRYSEIQGEKRFYGCNFKISHRKVEPEGWVKGLVARASMYMSQKYDIRMSKSQKRLFDAWSKQYPETLREIEWAKKVERVQGNSNPFIKKRGSSALPPKYLSVKGFKQCLKTKSMGSWDSYCLPSEKPAPCDKKSWAQLIKQNIPSC